MNTIYFNNIILVTLIFINVITSYTVKNTDLIDITDDQYKSFIKDLENEEYKDLHKYMLKYVIKPELADLNKDRKISSKELIKVLEYIVLPKSSELKETIGSDNIKSSIANIKLFVNLFEPPFTYKQFLKILYVMKVEDIANVDRVNKNVAANRLGIELSDDL